MKKIAIFIVILLFGLTLVACEQENNNNDNNNEDVTYTVTFNSLGGSEVEQQTVKEGEKATKPIDPTKDQFEFSHWKLNGAPYTFTEAVTKNITLIALWEDVVNENDSVMVTLIVTIPNNTPEGNIYLSGDLKNANVTTGWSGADVVATRNNLTATVTLTYAVSELPVKIEYKWTRGNWGSVEKGSRGEELGNRSLTITETVTKNDKVENWADLMENHENSTVVGNLNVVSLTYAGFTNPNQLTRNVRIWTPEGYNANDHKLYPVIYFHDGQNVFDQMTAFSGEWEADEAMTALMNQGFSGAILVGIDNSSERMGEYLYNHSFITLNNYTNTGHEYMEFLVEVVKPYVDENYNTLTGRTDTTIAGSSLGGMISLFGGLEHLDTFGNILAFSTSTQTVNFAGMTSYLENKDFTGYLDTKLFFYVGTSSDGDANWPANYKTVFEAQGFTNIATYIGQGFSHNEHAWKTHLPIALKWLYNING